jgi:hypothetical protein
MALEQDIDALFATPPREFVAARNELAAKAKAAKREDLAIRIRALRKPTAVVWLVNQLARRNAREVERLLTAANGLREAQLGALRGEGAESLPAANQAWRAAGRELVKRAREIAGETKQAFDEGRVAATLFGASAQPTFAKLLESGTLTDEVGPPDLETALGVTEAPAVARSGKARRTGEKPRKERDQRDDVTRRRVQERELAGLRREADRTAVAAGGAAKEASALERRAEMARKSAEVARKGAEDAQAAADAARRRVLELEERLTKAGPDRS